MRLTIAGDVSPTPQVMPFFERGDIATLFGDVPSAWAGSDRVIVNLECALTHTDGAIAKIGPNLKASPTCARVLKEIGVTDCALSNNHILDYGEEGLRDTLRALEESGLRYTGVGTNDSTSRAVHTMEIEGRRIALLSVCEHEYTYALPDKMGANPYDPYLTMADIRAAKAAHERVIVLYHGGKEYSPYPSPRLHRLCRSMVDNGADVVLCQHSHCIGCYEHYAGGHILYGQGNFHFVKESTQPGWYTGLLVQLDIHDTCRIEFVPVVMGANGIKLAHGEQRVQILDGFSARNQELADGRWLAGWEAFCKRVAPQYYDIVQKGAAGDATEGQREMFASYLHCEAHLDVLMAVFPTWRLIG